MMKKLMHLDWSTIGAGALAGYFFAQALVVDETWFVALSIFAMAAQVAVVSFRLTRRLYAPDPAFRAKVDAYIPSRIVLERTEDGVTALVTSQDGTLSTYHVPEEISEQGPQACIEYIAALVEEAVNKEFE